MVSRLLDLISGKAFEDGEVSIEKIRRSEFGEIRSEDLTLESSRNRAYCRLFRADSSETGFSISGSSEKSFKESLNSVSKLNPVMRENSDLPVNLPGVAQKIKLDIYDNSYENIGIAEFEKIKDLINDENRKYPGMETVSIKLIKFKKKYYLANTKGLNIKYRKTDFSLELKYSLNGDLIDISRHSSFFSTLNPTKTVQRAYTLLNSLTDNKLPKKKRYEMIFSPEASSSILRIFSVYFLPDKYSDVKKVNFPRVLNISDNKTLENEPGSVPFDDEGVQGFETNLIDKGVFNTPITNIKISSKNGVQSSGNGFRRGETPFPSLNFTNLYIKPTILSLGKLLNGAGEKILVSLVKLKFKEGKKYIFSAYGYIYKNGERGIPVHFHFSTTFLSFYLNIVRISKEIKFFFTEFNVGSPYLLLEGKNGIDPDIVEI